jgi:Pvc16 N-terminal domain/IPT/TIG domain
MSNFLAVATVTATMAQLIQASAHAAVSGALVSTRAPDAPAVAGNDPRVNLYLYQVTQNPAYRNADAPTRRTDGTLMERPQAALDLHYLISFYGNEGELVPQRLLGSTVSAIHSQPVLSRDSIRDLITNARYPHAADEFLKASDLADSVELIKFAPLPLSLEELSKLWSVMVQTPYSLSIAFQASVVLIQPDMLPQKALPVLSSAVFVHTLGLPVINRLVPQILEFAPAAQLTIEGQSLNAETVSVKISGMDAPPPNVNSDEEIVLRMPAGVMAGVQTVQVVHPLNLRTSQEPHKGFQSNLGVFILTPKIGTITYAPLPAPTVTITVQPAVGPRQRVDLALNSLPGAPQQAFSFSSTGRAVATSTIALPIKGVPAGTYIVRLSVDGAATALTVDGVTKLFNGPTVVVT